MLVEELCEKLRPIHGEKVERLWQFYLAARESERRWIELRLRRLYEQTFKGEEQVLLRPPPPAAARGSYVLGQVAYGDELQHLFGLREKEWIQHVNIFGRSGSGKTNLVVVLLWNLIRHGKPFLVFDWKRNYRDFLTLKGTEEVKLYTVGRGLLPFRFNPWIPPPGVPTEIWVRKIIEVLCHAYFGGEGVMDILTRSAAKAYAEIDRPFSAEILQHVDRIPEKSRQAQWKMSSQRILRALEFAGMGQVMRTRSNDYIPKLLNQQVILEMDSLADSDKTFLIEALLLWIHHYRLNGGKRERFRHAIIVEEAHHILRKAKQEMMGEAVTDVVLREIRELGEAVVTVDQHPSMISLPAIGNCFTTVCFNLKHQTDVNVAAQSMLLQGAERQYLGMLEVGSAIVKLQGRHMRPFLIRVPHVELGKGLVTDQELLRGVRRTRKLQLEGVDFEWCAIPASDVRVKVPCSASRARNRLVSAKRGKNGSDSIDSGEERNSSSPWPSIRVSSTTDKGGIGESERALLESIQEHPFHTTTQHYAELMMTDAAGNTAKNRLVEDGLVRAVAISKRRGRLQLLELTEQGRELLGFVEESQPSLEHRYWQQHVARLLEEDGHAVLLEPDLGGHFPDILAKKSGRTIIVEIETGKSDYKANHERALASGCDLLYILATSEQALRRICAAVEEGERTTVMPAKNFEGVA